MARRGGWSLGHLCLHRDAAGRSRAIHRGHCRLRGNELVRLCRTGASFAGSAGTGGGRRYLVRNCQIRTSAVCAMAVSRHGRADFGVGPASCCDHGSGGCLPLDAVAADAGACFMVRNGGYRNWASDGRFRRRCGTGAASRQEAARRVHIGALWPDVRRDRCWVSDGRASPSCRSCTVQVAAVPSCGDRGKTGGRL